MRKYLSQIRSAAIILISAGYGWAGGHYIPLNAPLLAYGFQFVIIAIILILGTGSVKGFTIFASLSLLINILNIIHGAFSSDKTSFGSHNTFADLVPIGLIMMGAILYLTTLSPASPDATPPAPPSNKKSPRSPAAIRSPQPPR